jgi:hypothetical protein
MYVGIQCSMHLYFSYELVPFLGSDVPFRPTRFGITVPMRSFAFNYRNFDELLIIIHRSQLSERIDS